MALRSDFFCRKFSFSEFLTFCYPKKRWRKTSECFSERFAQFTIVSLLPTPLSQSPIMSQFWHHPVWTNFSQITAILHWTSWGASVHVLCIWATCIWYSLMCFLCWECVFLSVLLCVRLYRGVSWVLSPSKSGRLTASTATGGGAVTSSFLDLLTGSIFISCILVELGGVG